VYGAVVCSYDAVSLFYLELYVKLSIYLSIYLSSVDAAIATVSKTAGIFKHLHLSRLQTMTQRQVSLACRREHRYTWSEMFNKGPRLHCHAVFDALLEVCPIVCVTNASRSRLCAYSQTLAAVRSSLHRYYGTA
jgi:hypothetical protein